MRCKIKSGHQNKQKECKSEESGPNTFNVFIDGRWLVFVNADRFRRMARQIEGLPDVSAIHVLTEGPGYFVGAFFRGQDAGRLDVIRNDGMFADTDLPGKFAEDVIRIGVKSLKVLVDFAEIVNGSELVDGKLFADAYVVPVAVIFGEIVRGFVRIEEDIFVPVIADALDRDAAPLKSDDFVVRAAKLATSPGE